MATVGVAIAQVIGQNVRRIRGEGSLTQQQVATELVRLGLPWSSGRVAQLEGGSVSPTLPVLVLIAAALDTLTPSSRSVTVVDLLVSDDAVALAPGITVPASALVGVVRGGAASALNTYRRPYGMSGESASEISARETYNRSDARAASTLGVGRDEMIALATALWGRNFSEERDARAQERGDTSNSGKGEVSRELMAELERELATWAKG